MSLFEPTQKLVAVGSWIKRDSRIAQWYSAGIATVQTSVQIQAFLLRDSNPVDCRAITLMDGILRGLIWNTLLI